MQNTQTQRDKNKDIWLSSQFTKIGADFKRRERLQGSVFMNVGNNDITE